jgi:hypothetical protein
MWQATLNDIGSTNFFMRKEMKLGGWDIRASASCNAACECVALHVVWAKQTFPIGTALYTTSSLFIFPRFPRLYVLFSIVTALNKIMRRSHQVLQISHDRSRPWSMCRSVCCPAVVQSCGSAIGCLVPRKHAFQLWFIGSCVMIFCSAARSDGMCKTSEI